MLSEAQIKKRQEQFLKNPVDGQVMKDLIFAGLTWLRTNHQTVNALNVFPVPDGDTGTNMVLTMQAAYDEVAALPEHNVGRIINSVAHGALMGARGNSGVILSQLWRGFSRVLDEHPILDARLFAHALVAGRDTAYKGVVRPVEGTILTVAADIATAGEEALKETDNVVAILERVVEAADRSVERTPSLLPVLREAGVVDAGGKGLYFILEGMLRYINGQSLETPLASIQPLARIGLEEREDIIEPGQDFEVVVDFRPHQQLDLTRFYAHLEELGTSIQVGEGDGIYRMHIHVPTEKRYEPIDYIMGIGTVTRVAIENLLDQMENREEGCEGGRLSLAPVEPGQIAVVAVAPGSGIARVFGSLGVAAIVEGGQTMNPSTQEIISAFEDLPTNKIIILPNNKNIIMAAKSAAELTVKRVAVVPTKTVPQGLAAMLRLTPDGDFDAVAADMIDAMDDVETGEVTVATRSVEIDGVSVQENQTIALLNGKLIAAAATIEEACLELLKKAEAEEYELITLFYGADMPKREVIRIADQIRAHYPEQDVEVQEGCQPHYQFIISIE